MSASGPMHLSPKVHSLGANTFLDEVMTQFLTCRLCHLPYRRPPKSLRCLHAFCGPCLERHQDSTGASPGQTSGPYRRYGQPHRSHPSATIVCPVCSRTTELPPGGVCRLPDNALLGQLGEVVHRLKETSQLEDTAADLTPSTTFSPLCDVCRSVREKTSTISGITLGKGKDMGRVQHGSWRTVSRGVDQSEEETDSDSPEVEDEWRNEFVNSSNAGSSCSLSFRNSWTNITARKESQKRRKRTRRTFENLGSSVASQSYDERIDRESKTSRRETVPTEDSRCSSSSGVSEISDEAAATAEAAVAVAKCIDCNKLLCEDCRRHHLRLTVTSGHSLVDVECSSDVECRRHHGESLRYYCQPCSVCICLLCTLDDHHHHEVTSLQDGMSIHRRAWVELVDRCRERRDQLRKHLDLVERAESERRETLTAIHRSANSAVAEIREREEEMVGEVEKDYGEGFEVVLDERSSILEDLKTLDNICHLAEIILENNSVELLLMKTEMEEKCGKLLDKEVHDLPATLSDINRRRLCFMNGNGLVMFGSVNTSEMSDASTETDDKFHSTFKNGSILIETNPATKQLESTVVDSPENTTGLAEVTRQPNSTKSAPVGPTRRGSGEGKCSNINDPANAVVPGWLSSERISNLDYLNCAIDNVVLTKVYYRRKDGSDRQQHRFLDEDIQNASNRVELMAGDNLEIKRKSNSISDEEKNLVQPDVLTTDRDVTNCRLDIDSVKITPGVTADNQSVLAADLPDNNSYPIDIILDTDFVIDIDEQLDIIEEIVRQYPADAFVLNSRPVSNPTGAGREDNMGGGFYVIVADVHVDIPLETFYVVVNDRASDGFNFPETELNPDRFAEDNIDTGMADYHRPESRSTFRNQLCVSCLNNIHLAPETSNEIHLASENSHINLSGEKLSDVTDMPVDDIRTNRDNDSHIMTGKHETECKQTTGNDLQKTADKESVSKRVTNVVICAHDDLNPIQCFNIQPAEVENITLRVRESEPENRAASSKTDTCTQTVDKDSKHDRNCVESESKAVDNKSDKIYLNEIRRIVNSADFKRFVLENNLVKSRHFSSLPGELNLITLLSSSDAFRNTTLREIDSIHKQHAVVECCQTHPTECFSTSEEGSSDDSPGPHRHEQRYNSADNDTLDASSKTEQTITDESFTELRNTDIIKPDKVLSSTLCYNSSSSKDCISKSNGGISSCSSDSRNNNNDSSSVGCSDSIDSSNSSNSNNSSSTIGNTNVFGKTSEHLTSNRHITDDLREYIDVCVETELINTRSVGVGELNSVTFSDVTTSTDVTTVCDVTTCTDVRTVSDVTTCTDVTAVSDVTTCTDVTTSNDATTSTEFAVSDVTTSTSVAVNDVTTSTDIILTSHRGCGEGNISCENMGVVTDRFETQNIGVGDSSTIFKDASVATNDTSSSVSIRDGAMITDASVATDHTSSFVSTSDDSTVYPDSASFRENSNLVTASALNGTDLNDVSKDGLLVPTNSDTAFPAVSNVECKNQLSPSESDLKSDTIRVRSVNYTELVKNNTEDWEGSDLDEAIIQAIPEVPIVTPEAVSFEQGEGDEQENNCFNITDSSGRNSNSNIKDKLIKSKSITDQNSSQLPDDPIPNSLTPDDVKNLTAMNSNSTDTGMGLKTVPSNRLTEIPDNCLAQNVEVRKIENTREISKSNEESETESDTAGEEDQFSSCLALNDSDIHQTTSSELTATALRYCVGTAQSELGDISEGIYDTDLAEGCYPAEVLTSQIFSSTQGKIEDEWNNSGSSPSRLSSGALTSLSSSTEAEQSDLMILGNTYESRGSASSKSASPVSSSVSSTSPENEAKLNGHHLSHETIDNVADQKLANFRATGLSPTNKKFTETPGSYSDLGTVLLTGLPSFLALADRTFSASTSDIPSNQVQGKCHVMRSVKSDESLAERWRERRGLFGSGTYIPSSGVSSRTSKEKESCDREMEVREYERKTTPTETYSTLTHVGFLSDDSIFDYNHAVGSLQVLEEDENFQSVNCVADCGVSTEELIGADLVSTGEAKNYLNNHLAKNENITEKIGQPSAAKIEETLSERINQSSAGNNSLRKCLHKPKLFISALFDLLSIAPNSEISESKEMCSNDRPTSVVTSNSFHSKSLNESSDLSSETTASEFERQRSTPTSETNQTDINTMANKCEQEKTDDNLCKQLLNKYSQISHSLDIPRRASSADSSDRTLVATSGQCSDNRNTTYPKNLSEPVKSNSIKYSAPKFNVRVHKLNVLKRLDSYDENSLN